MFSNLNGSNCTKFSYSLELAISNREIEFCSNCTKVFSQLGTYQDSSLQTLRSNCTKFLYSLEQPHRQ